MTADQYHAPMSGQSDYTDADAERLVLENDRYVERRAFRKILECAVAAEQVYSASGHITLIRQICELMLLPKSPQLRELLILTCEIEERPR